MMRKSHTTGGEVDRQTGTVSPLWATASTVDDWSEIERDLLGACFIVCQLQVPGGFKLLDQGAPPSS
jgi:hypothetical protein